jgi:hypothetical protein
MRSLNTPLAAVVRYSSRIDEIFSANRNAMKWTTPTSVLNLSFSFSRGR